MKTKMHLQPIQAEVCFYNFNSNIHNSRKTLKRIPLLPNLFINLLTLDDVWSLESHYVTDPCDHDNLGSQILRFKFHNHYSRKLWVSMTRWEWIQWLVVPIVDLGSAWLVMVWSMLVMAKHTCWLRSRLRPHI